jgi:peptidoglycan/LPS O-acetylase OafA/YrhL
MDFKKNINGLRAWAVIVVVLYHFRVAGFSAGFVGVDIFFVISGFLITGALSKSDEIGQFSFRRFYINRLRRIAPALAVLSLIVVFACGFYLLPSDYTKLLLSQLSALIYVSNIFFRNQAGYFDAATDTKPLIHTWSLSVEWQFYLLLPAVIWATRSTKRWRPFLFVTLAVASFIYSIHVSYRVPDDAFYLLPSRIWEFTVGSLLAILPLYSDRKPAGFKTALLSVIGMLLLLASLVFIKEGNAYPGWPALMPVLGAAFIIVENNNNWFNKFLSLPPLQFMGNISYSLYLWHWPILVWILQGKSTSAISTGAQFCGITLSVLLAYFSYRWIETPTRKNKEIWTNKRIVWIYFLAIVIAVAMVAIARRTHGMPFRLPSYLSRAEYAMHDSNPRGDECFIERADKRAKGISRYCPIGLANKTAPSLILWGDSFADSIQGPTDEITTKLGEKGEVATISGCPPIDVFPFDDPILKIRFPACATDFNKRVYDHIKHSQNIKTVVMAAKWILYDTDILERKLPEIACELKSENKDVVVFGTFPVADYDVPHTWAEQQHVLGRPIEEMTVAASRQEEAVQQFKVVNDAIVKKCGGVKIIYPMKTLCNEKDCFLVKNGISNYHDQWHLSTKGAQLLAKPLYRSLTTATSK